MKKEKCKVWESFLKGEKHMRYLTVLFITAALAGIASADILDTYVDNVPVPETKDLFYDMGFGQWILADTLVTNNLHFDLDSDWLSAVLVVSPDTTGMIYQNPGTPDIVTFPQAPDDIYLCKAHDSWISNGLGGECSTGVAVDFNYTEKLFTEDEIALTFYTDSEEIGDLHLAHITLSVEAQGTWQFSGTASPEGGPMAKILNKYNPDFEEPEAGQGLYGLIVDGEMIIVPEPATMGLLLVGGLGVLIRRKR